LLALSALAGPSHSWHTRDKACGTHRDASESYGPPAAAGAKTLTCSSSWQQTHRHSLLQLSLSHYSTHMQEIESDVPQNVTKEI